MPGAFKIGAPRTDAVTVSDTVVNETTNALLLDGEAPRLGTSSAPMLPNVPPPSAFTNVDSGPTLPRRVAGADRRLGPDAADAAGRGADPAGSRRPESGQSKPSGEPRHPMAHLMPEKIKPSEASLRAAEARAAQEEEGEEGQDHRRGLRRWR